MRRRIALSTVAAALVGVLAAGLVALGLVRSAYDGQARTVLHREAVLIANLQDVQRGKLAARAVTSLGVTIVRVRPNGAVLGRKAADPADVAAATAGRESASTRRIGGVRYLVEVQPVDTGGGVILLQPLSDARAVTSGVFRRLTLALALGLGAAVLIGVALARRLTQPLVRAADAAHSLAAGDRTIRLAEDGPDELADLSRSLNALAQALATSEAREREFLLSVSHELRTPLTGIRGFAEAIGEGVGDPLEAGRTIEAEAERMQRLVSDLLDLARAGADDFRLDLSAVDLRELVRDAATVWQRRCDDVGVLFSTELPAGPVVVHTDAGRIRQVLDGLAENALRVTPSDRPIVFAVQQGGVLQVRDGGPGLSPEDLPVAFERSVLYDRYRGVRQVGTGLGLALVGALVARLGGTAEAGRAPEGGACFTVRLPGQ
ncbi:MAG: integral rane sensor signal transduction histidine kinase [Frankiales bacterium]|nr:integral rane sensor signal transduction histidine kinase [Frankiales bacterium]